VEKEDDDEVHKEDAAEEARRLTHSTTAHTRSRPPRRRLCR
jgi:hypothetical protein